MHRCKCHLYTLRRSILQLLAVEATMFREPRSSLLLPFTLLVVGESCSGPGYFIWTSISCVRSNNCMAALPLLLCNAIPGGAGCIAGQGLVLSLFAIRARELFASAQRQVRMDPTPGNSVSVPTGACALQALWLNYRFTLGGVERKISDRNDVDAAMTVCVSLSLCPPYTVYSLLTPLT